MSDQNSGSLELEAGITSPDQGRTDQAPFFTQGRKRNRHPVCNDIPLVLCVITFLLDPLFCYVLVFNEEKKCLGLDKTLGVIASVLRSVIDLCYMVYRVCAEDDGSMKSWLYFVGDILVTFPLPQVLVFYVIPKLNDSRVFSAAALLSFIFTIQYVLRVVRFCSLLKQAICDRRIKLDQSTWANLSFLMLASHVVGSFWYLFSIERKATCWLEVCKHFGAHCSLYCDGTFKTTTYLKDSCSTNSPNPIPFNFGIYLDAIESGVVGSVGLIQRISYCFWWGLQNLSSLGHNLKTSAYIWEVYFSIFILLSGVVLISALIGAMQAHWLSKFSGQKAKMENKAEGTKSEEENMGLRNEVKLLEENQRLL